MPATVSIEPTTSCNLGCTQCPSGLKQFSRPAGSLTLDLYRKVIDGLSPWLMHLTLYFQGEPFLNPHFFHFAEYASRKRIFTVTSTNGHFLTPANARKTVESGLNKLIISIDGMDQETYVAYRVGGRLDKVTEGIRNIVEARRTAKSGKPYIELQFIVFGSNEHQIPEIEAFARESGADKLSLKSAQVYDFEEGHALIPVNSKYARYRKDASGSYVIRSPLPNHCRRMWQGCVITWDGRVVPCCFDKDAAHEFGSMQQTPFREIWRSEGYRQFRAAILRSRRNIDICSNCSEGLGGGR